MSNSDTPDLSNPFFERPDSKEARKFDEGKEQASDSFLNAVEKQSRTSLFRETVDGRSIITGSDSDRDSGQYRHDYDMGKPKSGRDAIYLFPESYNALRRELFENWKGLWQEVGYRMAHRADEFVECMNAALDLAVVFDTEKVAFISDTFLQELVDRRMRATDLSILENIMVAKVRQLFREPIVLDDISHRTGKGKKS